MSKADSILSARGGEIRGSAGHRPPPSAMPTTGAMIAPRDSRLIGLVRSKAVYEIPTDRISVDPDQPRKTIDEDELAKLMGSIRTNGLLHPIGVRYVEEIGGYRVIYGERRFKAFLGLERPSIAATVWDRPLSPSEVLTIQCAENLSRKDIRAIEQARSFRTLLDLYSITQSELAASVGVSEGTVAMSLRLLELPEDVQGLVADGKMAASAGYALAAKVNDPQEQRDIAERIVEQKMNREDAAQVIRKAARSKTEQGRGGAKGKPKVVTSRIFKTTSGIRMTAERKKGIDAAMLVESLREILAIVEGEGGESEAA